MKKSPKDLPTEREVHGIKNGYRSGLERRIAEQLDTEGIEYEYESLKIPFLQPAKPRTYTPDFILPNGIIIETKGRFLTADRQKHILIKEQHPDLDIRFVFSNSKNRINKGSPTTYAMWCERYGFLYAVGFIPIQWLQEPPRGSL
jgi:hypothetical protein